jgi:hypothetical protein
MNEAVDDGGFRPAMVSVVHSAGDLLGWHPHIHALVPRGGWLANGEWTPVPYLNSEAAEKLFRHKVLAFLKKENLISEERIELLLSWRHHTGFSVDMSVKIEPEDKESVARVARYIMRPPLSLERLKWTGDAVEYRAKGGSSNEAEVFDPLDFVARILMHAPEPRLHTVRYNGAYSSRSRAGQEHEAEATESEVAPAERRRQRRSWARMIAKIYEIDPLLCDCGATMKVISFITEYRVVKKIPDHIQTKPECKGRAPPAR